jgi:hypothetical protein
MGCNRNAVFKKVEKIENLFALDPIGKDPNLLF